MIKKNPNKKKNKKKSQTIIFKKKIKNENVSRIKKISKSQRISSKYNGIDYSKRIKILNNQSKANKKYVNFAFTEYQLNTMNYKKALKLDKRTFVNYYIH